MTFRQTKIKSVILALSFFDALFSANLAKAQTVPEQNIINQQDWIARQQQSKVEEERRLREQETIRKERSRKKKEAEEEGKKQTPISGKPAECFPIKSIALVDANSVSRRQKKKLTSPFIGKCVEAKTLTEIITAIQTYYNDEGYVTARVLVPKQNIQSGNLELKILEGKIDKIYDIKEDIYDLQKKLQIHNDKLLEDDEKFDDSTFLY